ncbi:MAG: DUF3857 and transglutaminase domain-containing protein [Opitutae bacterium]|nr:DUF3857 and transglutaminase domain-containing protein [Opitutae bacterium]
MAFVVLGFAPLRGAGWPALIPEELAATKSLIEPDADVEVLAREQTVDSSEGGVRTDYFFRLKAFTKAGAEKLAKIEIPYDKTQGSVTGIEARTIRPDGTVLELKSKDVFDREFVRVGSLRGRMKSFAPPGVEPGVIVEYRYRTLQEGWAFFTSFVFQSEHPSRSVVFRYRPARVSLTMEVLFLNYPTKELKPTRAGFYEFTLARIGSRKEEPLQPPPIHLWPSVLIYFIGEAAKSPEKYWETLSHQQMEFTRIQAKATKAVTAAAQRLVAAGDSDDEKLRQLHDYCRSKIVNSEREGAGLTKEQRRKLPANETAHDTLKHGTGTSRDINVLFVALAKAAGFDARLALANDRSSFIFSPKLAVPFSFVRPVAAVRRGDGWKFFDPGATFLPAGIMDWRNGETSLLVANDKGALSLPTQSAPAADSLRHQAATLTVNADGSLEGDVTLGFTGYYEAAEKNALEAATPDEIEKHMLATLEPHLKGVEVSAIKVENAAQPIEPLKVSFHLRVPVFAEITGSRLFVQPSVFRRAGKALFEAPTRENAIIFPHNYHELDEVTLALPAGVELEAGSAPPSIDLGRVGRYAVDLSWKKGRRVLTLRREFELKVLGFPRESYEKVKRLFEVIQERDDHTLTFQLREPPAADAAKP